MAALLTVLSALEIVGVTATASVEEGTALLVLSVVIPALDKVLAVADLALLTARLGCSFCCVACQTNNQPNTK